jgi:outer membrane protein assembly factor BamB
MKKSTLSIALPLGVAWLFAVLSPATADGDDWSRFRGPNGSGISETSPLPDRFGPTTNVVWKTELPAGHSSPVLSDMRIFLTAVDGDELVTIALDRESGEVLWRQAAPRPREEPLDPRNNPAAPSPAVGEEAIFVFFADFGLISYDHDGNERWRVPLGPFNNLYGMGASPTIVGDLVILVCDQNTDSFMIALDRATGETVWRVERPEAHSSHSTPILWESPEGQTQMLVPGSFLLDSYDPRTGEKIWWVRGLSFEMKSTPVIHDGVIYVNGYGSPLNQPGNQVELPLFGEVLPEHDADGDGEISAEEFPPSRASDWFGFVDLDGSGKLDAGEWKYLRAALESRNGMLAIRLGGRGDVTASNVLWEYNRAVPQLPSPIVYNDILYMVNDGGVVTSFDPETGEVIAQGRLKGAVDQYYASPVAADGKLFMLSELGMFSVLEPDGGLEPVSVADLDDLCYATPAISDGRIYVRTRSALYAFGLD